MTIEIIATIEEQRTKAQFELDNAKTLKQRNQLGQFSTPLPLAQEILKQVKDLWDEQMAIRFLDPALGTGAFYSALRHIIPSHQIQSATGIEVDPNVAQTAKELWHTAGLQVIQADFTTLPSPLDCKPNLIVANPPYVRHHHLSKETKMFLQEKIKNSLNLKINGLAGLYCYFLLIADQWLEERGLSTWLIPSEFMDVNYGDAIKHYLTNKVTLLRVHRFASEDIQFEDALVSSSILIFRKEKPTVEHNVTFTLGGTLGNPRISKTVPQFQLSNIAKWTSLPDRPFRYAVRDRNHINKTITIGDLFSIQRGIATGANEFFIIKRELAAQKELPEKFLRPILPSPRYLTGEEIFADQAGYPLVEPTLVLLDCDLAEESLAEFPTLSAYLAEGRFKGYADRYITRHRRPWFKQENRPIAPILCTYMSRGQAGRAVFRFFRNYSQATAPNVYLMLYPKPEVRERCQENPQLLNKVFILLKQAREEYLLHEGRTYGGGLNKIEPKELARVPLPDDVVLGELNLKPKQLILFER